MNIPLEYSVLTFEITPVDEMVLPSYPAITLRGGLGYALKNKTCLKDTNVCRETCQQKDTCIYPELFEEMEGVVVDGRYIPYARPYIIRSGHNKKRNYRVGEKYTFEIILFGKAIKHYPYFIAAMNRFGEKGIGYLKQPFRVSKVYSQQPVLKNVVYDGEILYSKPFVQSLSTVQNALPDVAVSSLTLKFHTPVRLLQEKEVFRNIEFVQIVENLLRRIESLTYFHQGEFFELDSEELIEQAFEVGIEHSRLENVKINRFSTRQKSKMMLDGQEGEITFKGNHLERYLPLLYLGQFIHVGKQTAFGLGQYEIEIGT